MPIQYLAQLTSPKRTAQANLHLGVTLASIAGALNAGGFLAVGQYTSHMTGIVSSAADDLILGRLIPAFAATLMLCAFVLGSASTALMVNYAKRNTPQYIYTPVLLLEASLLIVFGLVGTSLRQHEVITVSFTAVLLCYVMGLQNALITKISNAEIRTTHVTGLVTDVGIELGKMIYWNRDKVNPSHGEVAANRYKLRLHLMLISAFFCGGLLGAAGFKYLGFISTLPLALALVVLSIAPRFKSA
ncbi:YoaK family protein [Undibacterium sp. Xuan67W]|uniref:YoaK family protein n=1 Tax=Undibacterium sp. Xuan67W TaxID=3413057 RepID=UPI003BEF55A3